MRIGLLAPLLLDVVRAALFFGILGGSAFGAETQAKPSLRLTLPGTIYAVAGQPLNIYHDNLVLTETPEQCQFRFSGKVGQTEDRCWSVTPKADQIGRHRLSVHVTSPQGIAENATTNLEVVPAAAGQGKSIRLLIVGDSLTAGTAYPNEIARLLSLPGNPQWTMLGTHRPAWAAPGVAHEGYGGWTWAGFVSRFVAGTPTNPAARSSPFVFPGSDGRPVLAVNRYFRERCAGRTPDYVTIMLGINDCFGLKPDDPKAIDAGIDAMFKQSEILLSALRKAAPHAEIGICLTTPPNSREAGFEANYRGRYHRWGWKRIQHRLVQRQIEQFGGRESENLFIIPTEVSLDPVSGYPDNNGVHPNAAGYRQIGATIYAWLKWRLAQRDDRT